MFPAKRFVSMHVLVPGGWSVKQAHDLSEKIEADISQALPVTMVFVHVEPVEDHASWQYQDLDRSSTDGPENEPY